MEKVCPTCSKTNKINDQFCRFCGVKLGEEEPNQQQIIDTMEKSRKAWIIGFLIGFGTLIVLALIYIPIIIKWLVLSMLSGVLLFVILHQLWEYRGASKPRIFTISDKTIIIKNPRKPIFKIGWDEFDTLRIKKCSGVCYNLFFTGEDYHRTYRLVGEPEFHERTCTLIIILLETYAKRLGKEYIYGKKKKEKK